MNRVVIYLTFFLAIIIGLNSFIGENTDFAVTQNDLELKIPDYFPKPVFGFKEVHITPQGFMLGRKLFYDPILSKDSTISCGSCHLQRSAFAHVNQNLGKGINGLTGKRNVPVLQNLMWQSSFMLDGRVTYLGLQPLSPLTNPLEMDETPEQATYKLRQNKEYVTLFAQVFGDTLINSDKLFKALEQFTAMIISKNSRYDKFRKGEEKFSDQELSGLKLFRAHCSNCHTEPLFTDNSFRNDGLEPDTALKDSGRMAITHRPDDYMKFRVPSLRNVELSAPYEHDGRFKTLEQVLKHYSEGHFSTNNFDESLKRNIGLNEDDKAAIIAFLKTLTDKEFITDRRFADPN